MFLSLSPNSPAKMPPKQKKFRQAETSHNWAPDQDMLDVEDRENGAVADTIEVLIIIIFKYT